MKKIGLDFGTTNSIICYPDGGDLKPWQLGGAGGDFYVPSLLSVQREDGTMEIGRAARANLGDDDYRAYLGFKMLLGEDNPERLAARGYGDFSPRAAAAAYLRELIQSYQREQNIPELEGVVLTVPEIWVREGRHRAREELDDLCREIGLPILRLLSEPVAAAVYFMQAFRQREQRAFDGHLLVCDYGGGTLDLSLSKVEGNDITVLESAGFGNASQTIGKAGLAFDEAVLQRLYASNGRAPEHDARWFRNLKEFEEQKISKRESITKVLKDYIRNPKADKRLFKVDGLEVQCSDLAEVFDTLIKPNLQRSLQEMQAHLQTYRIDTRDGQNFRILLVGGFSAFHLVQHTVREFFGSRTDLDTRFNTVMDLTDTALAIAKGAALVAQETIRVHPKCPINLGIQATDPNTHEDKNLPILRRGTPIKSDTIVQYSDKRFRVSKAAALDKLALTLWVDDGEGQVNYIPLGGRLRNYLPTDSAQDAWEIGFSVSQNLLFNLHIRVAGTDNEKISRLGDLSANIS
ncbi:MAG: Hsp70 family protein [Gammaproteobacteria bacterium]|nr:Hsp70 family protein [Gammaproteobacteria bacterium]MBU1723638.1 Hsp70 family protein [Gammaproteobacteria bacterium]MBU2005634.1 Hsp70 family protein [Gammaproteobacteria bacterium]